MRRLLSLVACVAAMGTARAGDSYSVPAVGAQLAFRNVATTKFADKTVVVGQVYTNTITAVSGPAFAATIRPVALIYGCAEGDTQTDCIVAGKTPGAKREGNLLSVPVPADIGDAFAKQSSLKGRYFLIEEREFPMPGPKNADDLNHPEIGDTPMFVLGSTLNCDADKIAGFLPLGKTPHLVLPCRVGITRTHARVGDPKDFKSEEKYSMDLTYDGPGKASLPSGDWEVQKVVAKFAPEDSAHSTVQTESEIATKLGIGVKVRVVTANPTLKMSTETTSELIAYKP